MEVKATDVKNLRELTGAGMMACKEALKETSGDMEKAVEYLRKKGLSQLKKKAERKAKEGLVEAYIHAGGKVGVLVEVNCETDFVARNADFKEFVHDIAMQIAAQNPVYVSRMDVPEEVLEKEKDIYRHQAKEEKKPDNIIEKIIEGKLKNFYSLNCLLDQQFIKNQDLTIEEYLGEVAGKLGENIVVRRYTRYVLGDMS